MEKSKKKKVILISLGTAATGILGYFGWQWWKDRKDNKQQQQAEKSTSKDTSSFLPDSTSADTIKHKTYLPAPKQGGGSSGFPLRKGSKGSQVKAMQQALIAKYGASILPRYGADGDFGNEVAAALKKEGLPSEIDQSTYNVLVQGATDYQQLADKLHDAAENSNLNEALTALKQMKTTDDYAAVNKLFEANSINFVSKTIVNGLLDAFSDESQKQQVRLEFTRMGLKYDGTKWALSGLDDPKIITTKATQVFEKGGRTIPVPPNVVLGFLSGEQGDWTYFYPNNAELLMRVKTETVTQYKPKQ